MIEITEPNASPAERIENVPCILQAMTRAVREALARHKRAANPVAVWRHGHVEWVSPEDIPAEDGSLIREPE